MASGKGTKSASKKSKSEHFGEGREQDLARKKPGERKSNNQVRIKWSRGSGE